MSVEQLRAELRASYVASGDLDALRVMDEMDREEARTRTPWTQRLIAAAPALAVLGVVAFSMAATDQPVTNVEHDLRVILVATLPLLAKTVAAFLLG